MRRRTVLGSALAGAFAGLAAARRPALAQDATLGPKPGRGHPIVGVWLVTTPIGPSLARLAMTSLPPAGRIGGR